MHFPYQAVGCRQEYIIIRVKNKLKGGIELYLRCSIKARALGRYTPSDFF